MAKSKISIEDDSELRDQLEKLILACNHNVLVDWSILLASRLMLEVAFTEDEIAKLNAAFLVASAQARGEALPEDVSEARIAVDGLIETVHEPLKITVLRICAQAVGVAHMREHAQVMADYAVKAINQKYPGDAKAVSEERRKQIDSLNATILSQTIVA